MFVCKIKKRNFSVFFIHNIEIQFLREAVSYFVYVIVLNNIFVSILYDLSARIDVFLIDESCIVFEI